jgi:hypothetical protein
MSANLSPEYLAAEEEHRSLCWLRETMGFTTTFR